METYTGVRTFIKMGNGTWLYFNDPKVLIELYDKQTLLLSNIHVHLNNGIAMSIDM